MNEGLVKVPHSICFMEYIRYENLQTQIKSKT